VLWEEASALTAPAESHRSEDDGILDCMFSNRYTPAYAATPPDVIVHGQATINGLRATILSSDDPDELVRWLNEHDYTIREDDAGRFVPYVDRGWFFTAMRPDSAGLEMPPEGWDSNVDPVVFTFHAAELELPLPILAINRAESLPIVLYVVDDHRMTLPAFTTFYANRLSPEEYEAIAALYPTLSSYLAPGRMLTAMSRTFTSNAAMTASVVLERAPNDDEYRRAREGGGYVTPLVELGILPLPLLALRGLRAIRRRRGAAG
jgi:hypothetical protein